MRIGFIMPTVTVSYSGGVAVQGRMWKEGLEALGNECFLINQWDKFDLATYDYIIFLGMGRLVWDYATIYKRMFPKTRLVYAPIIDPVVSVGKFHLRAKYYGSQKLHLRKDLHDIYMSGKYFDFYLARSEFEKRYIVGGFDIPEEKVYIVPVSMRIHTDISFDLNNKGKYCLHISRLAAPGKNVSGLIKAARKYNFKLRLAGTLPPGGEQWLKDQIGDAQNIEYIGWLTDKQLIEEYKKAKVFALPSFVEGVGMVALEAAAFGADIVLTDIGAPKEYYKGRATLVNPYDIDSIGKGVLHALGNTRQPELSKFILDNYSLNVNCKQLADIMQLHL